MVAFPETPSEEETCKAVKDATVIVYSPLEKDICTLLRSQFLEERLNKGSLIFQGLFPRRECVCCARVQSIASSAMSEVYSPILCAREGGDRSWRL